MIPFDDLTELEKEIRALLDRPRSHWGRSNTPFALWARAIREEWERSARGQRAIAECELKRGKIRRRAASR